MQYTTESQFPGNLDAEPSAPGRSVEDVLRYGPKRQEPLQRPRLARSPLSNRHNGPRVEYAVGGTYAKLCIPGIESPTKPAKRSNITDFSAKSRRGMLDLLSKVDHDKLALFAYFGTFTWPCKFSRDRRDWTKKRRALIKRLKRQYNIQAVVWKLEPQDRLAPHYHMLIFSHDEIDNAWVAHAWHEIMGTDDHNHLLFHLGELADERNVPCTSRVNSFDGVKHYCAEYCGKKVDGGDLPPWWHGGRWWGVEGELPMTIEIVELTENEALDMRRWMRKLYQSKVGRKFKTNGMGGVKLYANHHTIEKMLGYAAKVQRERIDQSQPDLVDLHLLAGRGKTAHQGMIRADHDPHLAGEREQKRLERYGLRHKTPEECRSVMEKYGFGQVEQKWGAA